MSEALGSLEKVLRVGEGRRLKRLRQQADYITSLEPEFEKLSDGELAGKTAEFRQRIDNGEPVDELVFDAFAAVREAFKRTMDVRLFDVQLEGTECDWNPSMKFGCKALDLKGGDADLIH